MARNHTICSNNCWISPHIVATRYTHYNLIKNTVISNINKLTRNNVNGTSMCMFALEGLEPISVCNSVENIACKSTCAGKYYLLSLEHDVQLARPYYQTTFFSLVRYLGSKFNICCVVFRDETVLIYVQASRRLSRQILRLTEASGFQLKACACQLPHMQDDFFGWGGGGWRDVKEFSIRCCVLI